MKRICLYGGGKNLGGTEIYLITLVRALKDDVVFDYLIRHDYGEIPFENEIISYGGKIYRQYYRNSERNLPDYLSPKEVLDMHPEWDGIYLNLQKIDTSYRLLLEAKKKGLSYRIIHSHSNMNDLRKRRIKDQIYNLFFMITNKYVVSSFFACSSLAGKSMFGNNSSFDVIPNAVDFSKFQLNDTVRAKKRKEFHICDDEIVIGFCGRFAPEKNPEFLIEIFHEIKKMNHKCKLLLVGQGELETVLRQKADHLNILNDIIFAGSVLDTQEYYQMMDCFVLPSNYEGFGIVLLEAQAAGLRCYTTADVVPKETNITGRVTFISASKSAAYWAETILKNGFERKNCLDILEKGDYTIDGMRHKFLNVLKDNE